MPKRSIAPLIVRTICFLFGFICSVYVINAMRFRELTVPLRGNKFEVVSQTSDPAIYWGLLIFMSLMAAGLFYVTFIAKDDQLRK